MPSSSPRLAAGLLAANPPRRLAYARQRSPPRGGESARRKSLNFKAAKATGWHPATLSLGGLLSREHKAPIKNKKRTCGKNKRCTFQPTSRCIPRATHAKRIESMSQANLRLVEGTSVDKTKALDAALSQIERAFGKGSIMRLGKNQAVTEIETISTGSLGLDIALGRRRPAARPRHRNLRPGILRQDHAGAAHHRRSAEDRRRLRLRRRRTCARSGLCAQTGRQARRSSDLSARHRRTGAGNHRHAGALRRRRRAGDRFGRGPGSPRRNRRRNGRRASPACRPG